MASHVQIYTVTLEVRHVVACIVQRQLHVRTCIQSVSLVNRCNNMFPLCLISQCCTRLFSDPHIYVSLFYTIIHACTIQSTNAAYPGLCTYSKVYIKRKCLNMTRRLYHRYVHVLNFFRIKHRDAIMHMLNLLKSFGTQLIFTCIHVYVATDCRCRSGQSNARQTKRTLREGLSNSQIY